MARLQKVNLALELRRKEKLDDKRPSPDPTPSILIRKHFPSPEGTSERNPTVCQHLSRESSGTTILQYRVPQYCNIRYIGYYNIAILGTKILQYQVPQYCNIGYHNIAISGTTISQYPIRYHNIAISGTTILQYQVPQYRNIRHHNIAI